MQLLVGREQIKLHLWGEGVEVSDKAYHHKMARLGKERKRVSMVLSEIVFQGNTFTSRRKYHSIDVVCLEGLNLLEFTRIAQMLQEKLGIWRGKVNDISIFIQYLKSDQNEQKIIFRNDGIIQNLENFTQISIERSNLIYEKVKDLYKVIINSEVLRLRSYREFRSITVLGMIQNIKNYHNKFSGEIVNRVVSTMDSLLKKARHGIKKLGAYFYNECVRESQKDMLKILEEESKKVAEIEVKKIEVKENDVIEAEVIEPDVYEPQPEELSRGEKAMLACLRATPDMILSPRYKHLRDLL